MNLFTEHARNKLLTELLKLGVTEKTVLDTIEHPAELLYDPDVERYVAVNWGQRIAVIYEKKGEDTLVITVIYSSTLTDMVDRRRRSGRWI